MKFKILGLIATVICIGALFARSPFKPHLEKRFKENEQVKYLKVRFNTNHSSQHLIGSYGLGEYLPAKSIILRSFLYVEEQFVDAASGTVAIQCEDANNIKTATDISGSAADAFIEGESTGSTATMKTAIAAPCEVTAVLAGASTTAGALNVYIEYSTQD